MVHRTVDEEPRDGTTRYLWWGLGAAALAAVGYGFYRLGQPAALPGKTYLLEGLAAVPFPQQSGPGAAVIVPPGFVPSSAMRVCVYIRGFSSCISSIVADADEPCSPGGMVHRSSYLAQQLTASGAKTLVILPELIREAQSGDPGQLARAGSYDAMVNEVLARMAPVLGNRSVADIAHLGVMSHSGGYQAAAAIVRQRPPALRTVALLDSLYGNQSDFAAWVSDNARGFTPGGGFRIADIFTDGGGTAAKSRALANAVGQSLSSVGLAGFLLDEDAGRTLSLQEYEAHPALFKRSGLSHIDVSRHYPQWLWAAGW